MMRDGAALLALMRQQAPATRVVAAEATSAKRDEQEEAEEVRLAAVREGEGDLYDCLGCLMCAAGDDWDPHPACVGFVLEQLQEWTRQQATHALTKGGGLSRKRLQDIYPRETAELEHFQKVHQQALNVG